MLDKLSLCTKGYRVILLKEESRQRDNKSVMETFSSASGSKFGSASSSPLNIWLRCFDILQSQCGYHSLCDLRQCSALGVPRLCDFIVL